MAYDQYTTKYGPQLAALAMPPQGPPSFMGPQPAGAFGGVSPVVAPQGGAMSGAAAPPPGPALAGAGPQPAQGAFAGAMTPQPQGEAAKTGKSFKDVFDAGSDEEKTALADQFEKTGLDLKAETQKIAQKDPDLVRSYGDPDKLTREEMGGIMMEFGLRMMSSQGSFGEAIGEAGLGALGSARGLKAQKRAERMESEEKAYSRDQDRKKYELDDRRTSATEVSAEASKKQAEAALKRAEKDNPNAAIGADASGNAILIDKNTGKSIPVLDPSGKPVPAGALTKAQGPSAWAEEFEIRKQTEAQAAQAQLGRPLNDKERFELEIKAMRETGIRSAENGPSIRARIHDSVSRMLEKDIGFMRVMAGGDEKAAEDYRRQKIDEAEAYVFGAGTGTSEDEEALLKQYLDQ